MPQSSMETTVEFTPARAEDEALLLDFIGDLYAQEGIPYEREAAAEALRPLLAGHAPGAVWVLRAGEAAIGYLALIFSYYLEFGPTSILDEVYVTPAWRGRGIGARAVAFAEAESLRRGMRKMRLEVERHNPARALYMRNGFVAHDRDLMTRSLEPGG